MRAELLKDQTEKAEEDPHAISVCTWYPKLKELLSMLSKNYEILKNDPILRKVLPDKPITAFRRKKNIRNILCRNDVKKQKEEKDTEKCKGCQHCKVMSNKGEVVNGKIGSLLRANLVVTADTLGLYMQLGAHTSARRRRK